MLPTTPYRIHLEYLGFDPSTSCLLSTHASDCANTPMLPSKRQEQTAEAARGGSKTKKTYSTRDSLVVPYQSTDRAQRCLTSQFGWDAVLSPWYDRMTRASEKSCTCLHRKKILHKKSKRMICSFFFFSRPVHSWPFIRRSHQEHQVTKC